MLQCRLDSKSGLSLLAVLSLVLIFRFATSLKVVNLQQRRTAQGATMIFLATVFAEKRHPYARGLLSTEQNCGILTNNTCKKSIFHAYPI